MIDGIGPMPSATPNQPTPKNAAEAATQFEALLIHQLLQTAHEEEDTEDQTGDTMWDVAAQQFAQVMAEGGGLGLAKLVTQGLGTQGSETP